MLAEGRAVDDRIAGVMGRRIRRMLAEPPWSTVSGIVGADEMDVGRRKKPMERKALPHVPTQADKGMRRNVI